METLRTPEAQRDSTEAKRRNDLTIVVTVVDNGFIVKEAGTGATRVYTELGLDGAMAAGGTVADHLRDFVSGRREKRAVGN